MNNPLIIETKAHQPATHSIIWCHGLGASSDDFAPIVPELQIPDHVNIRFIFPNAPMRPVTINHGYVMPAWYDILSLDRYEEKEDTEGLKTSRQFLEDLIQKEVADGIPYHRIFLAGFSQGCAISLLTATRLAQPIAGVIALSGYLPLLKETPVANEINRNIPIFMAHGTFDPVVHIDFAKRSYEHLKSLGYDVDFYTYPMEHTVCLDEIAAIRTFLRSHI